MTERSEKHGILVISLVLSCSAFFSFLSALKAIEQGHIWNFLLFAGGGLTILLSPKDRAFFNTNISSLRDLTKLNFYTDPLTAAFLTMAECMMVAGMLGLLFWP